ncbi:MAG: hypothetical protein LIP05_08430 [Tannerellaceae bacterium]|nr:hypothetical protein [Tannerellaceae bacterium]
MAFTENEEAQVRAMLTAFSSGKKINDLTLATGGVEEFMIEVQKKNGESGRINLYSAISIVNQKIAIRRWDETLSSPVGEAFGNIDFLRELPSVLGLGCYLVTDDRKRKKLDPTNHYKYQDGSPAKLDGSEGQYMWCWNTHYYASWKEGNYFYEAVSLNPIDGKECYRIPEGGTSALGAGVVDRTDLKLCSLISNDARYRGGNNLSTFTDDNYKSLLSKPAHSIALNTFSTYARKRGEGWEANWYVSRAVQEYLFRIIMGTRHSQTAVNANKDANGLYQGGLGAGVTNFSSAEWLEWSESIGTYQPMIPTSVGVELEDGVGQVPYNVLNRDGSVFKATNVPVFFGLKNMFGNLWQGQRGLIIDVGSEKSIGYVAPSLYADYSNTSVSGLIQCAELPRTATSYIKKCR